MIIFVLLEYFMFIIRCMDYLCICQDRNDNLFLRLKLCVKFDSKYAFTAKSISSMSPQQLK